MIKEVESYLKAKEDLAHVSKGGAGYASCSFMDISVRIDREKEAKKKAIKAIGEIELKNILKDLQ